MKKYTKWEYPCTIKYDVLFSLEQHESKIIYKYIRKAVATLDS